MQIRPLTEAKVGTRARATRHLKEALFIGKIFTAQAVSGGLAALTAWALWPSGITSTRLADLTLGALACAGLSIAAWLAVVPIALATACKVAFPSK